MADTTQAQKDRLMHDLQMVVSEAEALLRATADDATEGVAEVRAKMQAKLAQAKAGLIRAQDVVVERAKEAGHAADDYVHDNPWRAIAAAAGVGVIVGLLIGRR